ncbi:MAG: ATP-dependent DNA helicase [Acidobacteria bacterium]|nr:ATP-dependent DNA helicase [Acidobacteriota bacterium]
MSQVSPVSGAPDLDLAEQVRQVFADDGALARVIDGYEPREGQRQMAEAVAGVLEDGGTLLAEAGTGTGKTLAYLAPAILSGRRVLVSTGTKNLQEQIFFKDLPLLQQALGVPFTATLMKGRGNYLCLHRWELYRDAVEEGANASGRLIDAGDRVLLPIVDAWLARTETGDRAELRELPEDVGLWKAIAAEAETCLGSECPHYDDCFVTRMRRRAAESDVVIVNHHLLCADASVRQSAYGEVIPPCPTLVIDEAHQLEDIATQYFGYSFSVFRVDDLVRDVERILIDDGGELTRALARASECSRIFFSGLALRGALQPSSGSETRVRYTAEALAEHDEEGSALVGALEGLETALAAVKSPDDAEVGEALAALHRRAGELARDLRFLLRAADPDFVYYVETRGRTVFLRASPIDVSRIVREALVDHMRAVVLTSATLAVDGSFSYLKGRLGIRDAEELRVPSEFDYARQALLYLPRRVPSPRAPMFAQSAAREIVEILRRSRGRAFVLFTSYHVLRTVQPVVEMALPYPILVQGTAPRTELIERFRTTPHAVLLATSSFWQGVDVVGEALSCVIIDKLPFASPADPVTAARIDAIESRGGDAFADYQVPLAILALQQGLGRLIRHRRDRGVLAVLDPRLRTMGYGQRFLASLPPAPVTHELGTVERFFV